MSEVKLADIIDIPIREFLEMPPAPGHRDSEARAQKAIHLRALVPEHLEVEIAEYRDHSGILRRVRMTGNTRAQVWKCGLSDQVPNMVRARVYRMADEHEVRQRMLRHDSQEAAWSASDYIHRALDMTFGDNWRPRSKAISSGRFTSAVRVADSLVNHSRWSPDREVKVEMILPGWRKELQILDELTDHPLADAKVAEFARAVFNDRGEKADDGYDGVQALIENLGRGKFSGTIPHQQKILMCVVGAFDQWENGIRSPGAIPKIRKFDPLDWIRRERARKGDDQSPAAESA